MNNMKKKKLVSVKKYAELCGICMQGVYNRINRGTLKVSTSYPVKLIDCIKYSPKLSKRGRPAYKD